MIAEPGWTPEEPDISLDDWVAELRIGLAAAPSGSEEQLDMLAQLASALVQRYEERAGDLPPMGGTADLGEAIAAAEQVLAAPDAHWLHPQARLAAGAAYYNRLVTAADPSDLDAAIRHLSAAADLLPDETSEAASVADLLGELLLERARMGGQPGDADVAIVHMRRALASAEPEDPQRPVLAARLGLTLSERVFQSIGQAQSLETVSVNVDEVETAFQALTEAEQGHDQGDELYGLVIAALGLIQAFRFVLPAAAGGAPDRDAAIGWLERVERMPEIDGELRLMCQQWLGRLLLIRALPDGMQPGAGAPQALGWTGGAAGVQRPAGAAADLDRAIALLTRVVEAPGQDELMEAVSLVLLGQALVLRRLDGLGGLDLDRIIACFDAGLERLHGRELAGRAELLAMLGWMRNERGLRRAAAAAAAGGGPGGREDMRAAAAVLAEAERRLSNGHPARPLVLRELGLAWMRLGQAQADATALSRSMDWLTAALGEMPRDHPLRTDTLGDLGVLLMGMLWAGAPSVPLDRAVAYLTEALADPPADPARHALFRCGLGQAMAMRWVQDHGSVDLDVALQHMNMAADLLPPDHVFRLDVRFSIATMLLDRYDFHGEAQDLDAAMFYLEELDRLLAAREDQLPPGHLDRPSVRATLGIARLRLFLHRGDHENSDATLIDRAVGDLELAYEGLPPTSPLRSSVLSELGSARMGQALARGDLAGIHAGTESIIAAARDAPGGHVNSPSLLARAGSVLVTRSVERRDPESLDRGIALLTEALSHAGFSHMERARLLGGLGGALLDRYQMLRRLPDLDASIERLQAARKLLERDYGAPTLALLLSNLSTAYRIRSDPARGDRRSSLECGLAALRARARGVLLETGGARGIGLARVATEDVTRTAMWCLQDERLDLTVEVLELGRGLVLHAATVSRDVPALLREAGHDRLAADWEAAAARAGRSPWEAPVDAAPSAVSLLADPTPGELPPHLRHRVLAALAGTPAEHHLLSPPTAAEVAATLRAAEQDAIVYLLPRVDQAVGRAVLISADGAVSELLLPLLHTEQGGRVATYAAAQRRANALDLPEGERATAQHWWRGALSELCEWAWEAVVSPLLDHVATWRLSRLPRLTLVPVGLLSVVPWHAARTRKAGRDGRFRYACEASVLSYAASARQLGDAISRPRRPLQSAPVVVGNPNGGLPFATLEAEGVHQRYYPEAVYLGSSATPPGNAGTPDAVLSWLPAPKRPGASMLHLGCHARTGSSPEESYLELAGGQRLPVSRILRQAQGRAADASGGLVVLAACTTDLTQRDHDEALTLATAFLAAGAVSVVGSRWQVPDIRSALLMFMFHRFLNPAGQRPAASLRAAQLWMLDVDREIPADMPPLLRSAAANVDLADVVAWAGFTHHGQ